MAAVPWMEIAAARWTEIAAARGVAKAGDRLQPL